MIESCRQFMTTKSIIFRQDNGRFQGFTGISWRQYSTFEFFLMTSSCFLMETSGKYWQSLEKRPRIARWQYYFHLPSIFVLSSLQNHRPGKFSFYLLRNWRYSYILASLILISSYLDSYVYLQNDTIEQFIWMNYLTSCPIH